jgi:hypothetical protein
MSLKLSRRRPISGSVSIETTETPEELLERVAELVHERQVLRAAGAGRSELERNRAEIARAQWDLSRALIVRHHR